MAMKWVMKIVKVVVIKINKNKKKLLTIHLKSNSILKKKLKGKGPQIGSVSLLMSKLSTKLNK